MMRSFFHATACALLMLAALAAGDETQFSMRKWETDEGLPHNGVNGIYQGREGFLWLATQGGLTRFDGLEFVVRRSPLLTNARTSRVVDIIEENSSTLLVGCDVSGLVRMTKDGFSVHPLGEAMGEQRRINSMLSEAPDVFWILRSDRQVWRWDHGKIIHFPQPVGANVAAFGTLARGKDGSIYVARGIGVERFDGKDLVRVPEIEAAGLSGLTICASANGGLWLASADALLKWDGGAPVPVPATVPWSQAPPIAMLEDREGAVWIGSKADGLFRCSGTEIRLIKTSHERIASLHEDREGNLWAGTSGGGLNQIQHARFQVLDKQAGWTPDIEGCVTECPPGKMWFANSGVGLRQVSEGLLLPPPDLANWPGRAIPMYPDPDRNLWVGANAQLLRVTPDLSVPPERVGAEMAGKYHAIYVTPTGTVWGGGENFVLVSVQEGKLTSYGPESGYTGKQAQAICEDTAGYLWVGTEEGDLFRGKDGRFTNVEALPGPDRSGIRALHGDAQGNLWVGTGGAGLLVKRKNAGDFATLTVEQGLPDGVISQIVEDGHGMLWLFTSVGLMKAAKGDLLDCAAGKTGRITVVRYGKEDGLEGFSAAANYQPGAWKAKDGRLWFVSRKGIVIADPREEEAAERTGPRVIIETLLVDGKARAAGDNRIPSVARKLDFDFTAPTFISPEKVRFRYRLAGLEQEWNEGGKLRTASYAQLTPGKYQFEVIACNSDLVWNTRAAVFPFEVVPAWWETWLARTLALMLGAGLLTMAVRYWSHQRLKARLLELEANRRIDMERSRIARDLHDGLGAGLTQIGMMAEELAEDMSDPQEMKTYSTRIAGRARGIARDLDAAVWAVSPKNDTLAALSAYIGQYAIEYFRETPVRCRVELPESIPDAPLSPDARHHLFLMAKEIMNNVLKHSGARNVTLAIRTTAQRFHLEIADDGHGFPADDAATAGRHGLKNIRERVAELGGSVVIHSSSAGTTIAIELPLPKH